MAHKYNPQSTLAQMERSPYDDLHNLYSLPALLQNLGLLDWSVRLFQFLYNYDGIEYFFGIVGPGTIARQLLIAELLQLDGPGSADPERIKRRVAKELCEYEFSCCGASWWPSNGLPLIVWKPLEQCFLDFVENEPANIGCYELDVSPFSKFAVKPEDIQRFLLS